MSNEWNTYAKEVDDWTATLEEIISIRTEDQGSLNEESEKIRNEIGKLKEISEEEDNEIEIDDNRENFIKQVDKIALAFEDWQNSVDHESVGDPIPIEEESERNSVVARVEEEQAIPPGGHRLPPLPYAYDALEPVISEEIMRIHHDEHHRSYVEGLNKAELEMKKARETNIFDLIKHWEREAAFNGAGHYLHTMFWNNMSPQGGGKPDGKLKQQIDKDFGSFDAFKNHFSEAAKEVQGVGWAILVWSPRARRLEILQAKFHHLLSQWDVIPLLGLDVWEHAYYLQYKNNRDEYVDNFWSVINWHNVTERCNEAKKVKWQPF